MKQLDSMPTSFFSVWLTVRSWLNVASKLFILYKQTIPSCKEEVQITDRAAKAEVGFVFTCRFLFRLILRLSTNTFGDT